MKNKKTFSVMVASVSVILLTGLLLTSGFAKNGNNDLKPSSKETKRVVIVPNDADSELKIKQNKNVEIMHEFDGKFSAQVNIDEIDVIQELAQVDDVVRLEISQDNPSEGPKYCGDGEIHPSEQCGEPGLDACSDNKVCNYCQCKNPQSSKVNERTCEPRDQIPYNVAQVNGGQIKSGDKIDVAVLDTGAFVNHQDLNIKVCKDTTGKGIRNGCEDTIYHGTHVIGTVGAHAGADQLGIYGVAPSANLWAIKVCYSTFCNDDDIAEAINYAAKRGAEIISMSFGSDVETPLIEEAIQKHPNVLFVAAAGNRGYNGVKIEYPGAYPEVIAVAAIDKNKKVTSFSARGVNDNDDSVISAQEVEFAAGGSSVESAFSRTGCYAYSSGTSMSTPTISGLAAKVWQGDAQSTRLYLRSIAQDITLSNGPGAGIGFDVASGYGLPVAP